MEETKKRAPTLPTKCSCETDNLAHGCTCDARMLELFSITRTFRNPSGKEYTRVEKVRKPLVIETYVKVRETKVRDLEHICDFLMLINSSTFN